LPHLVEMHKKLEKDGFAVITVCLDDVREFPEAKDLAPKILKSKGAIGFTNLLLDEPVQAWQDKLRFAAAPCLYVFSRQGKWTQFKSDEMPIDHDAVNKLVVELLREK
jgi:hypothetical protein